MTASPLIPDSITCLRALARASNSTSLVQVSCPRDRILSSSDRCLRVSCLSLLAVAICQYSGKIMAITNVVFWCKILCHSMGIAKPRPRFHGISSVSSVGCFHGYLPPQVCVCAQFVGFCHPFTDPPPLVPLIPYFSFLCPFGSPDK